MLLNLKTSIRRKRKKNKYTGFILRRPQQGQGMPAIPPIEILEQRLSVRIHFDDCFNEKRSMTCTPILILLLLLYVPVNRHNHPYNNCYLIKFPFGSEYLTIAYPLANSKSYGDYVGEYELIPQVILKVTLIGDKLMWGRKNPVELIPEDEHTFVYNGRAYYHVRFELDNKGKVSHLRIIEFPGVEYSATKVK